jgi:glutamate-1-semialdehyde 2,1-aminomutase
MNSADLFEKSLQLVPGGVHSPVRSFKGLHTTPRFINRADGAYIFDEDGKDYVDFCMSFGPLILGHQNPVVKEELIRALDRGWTFGACEKYSLELAEYIVSRIPFIDQIRFVNSGTEAVMTAIRLARGYTEKPKILKFNGCYHGHVDGMLIKAGSGLAGTADASSKGVTKANADETLIVELGDIEAVKKCFEDHKDQIAAIIIEPLPANNGLLIQEESFLKELREICSKNNSLLIFDEVISGFRVGFGGMSERLGITPDMVTYGKIIGGGMPVGAVAAKRDIMEILAPVGGVYQAGTLSANPMAMVAGLSTLTQLTDDLYKTVEKNTTRITSLFKKWMDHNGYEDYNIIQYDSLFWLVPTDKKYLININQIPSNLTDRFHGLFENFLNAGIYLSPNAYEVGFGSFAHNEDIALNIEERLSC